MVLWDRLAFISNLKGNYFMWKKGRTKFDCVLSISGIWSSNLAKPQGPIKWWLQIPTWRALLFWALWADTNSLAKLIQVTEPTSPAFSRKLCLIGTQTMPEHEQKTKNTKHKKQEKTNKSTPTPTIPSTWIQLYCNPLKNWHWNQTLGWNDHSHLIPILIPFLLPFHSIQSNQTQP